MTTLKERYDALGPAGAPETLWDQITNVVAQSVNDAAFMRLNAEVIPQGRYVERASGAERAPRRPRRARRAPRRAASPQ